MTSFINTLQIVEKNKTIFILSISSFLIYSVIPGSVSTKPLVLMFALSGAILLGNAISWWERKSQQQYFRNLSLSKAKKSIAKYKEQLECLEHYVRSRWGIADETVMRNISEAKVIILNLESHYGMSNSVSSQRVINKLNDPVIIKLNCVNCLIDIKEPDISEPRLPTQLISQLQHKIRDTFDRLPGIGNDFSMAA